MRPGITKAPVDVIATLPEIAGAGSFIVTDPRGIRTDGFVLASGTGWYRVDFVSGAVQHLTDPAAGLTFGAGLCGVYDPTGPIIYCFGPGTGGGVDSWTASYTIATGVWAGLDAGNTMDALLGATWATDGAMVHPCQTIAATASDDLIYLTGNGALVNYQYSIIGDTWTTAPPANRGAAAGAGCTFDWPSGMTTDILYSLNGGGAATGEAYSILGDAWGGTVYFPPLVAPLPDTGTSSCVSTDGRTIYYRVNATGTVYRWNPMTNALDTVGQLYGPDGVATVGGKIAAYEVGGVEYIVAIVHGSTQIQRMRIVK